MLNLICWCYFRFQNVLMRICECLAKTLFSESKTNATILKFGCFLYLSKHLIWLSKPIFFFFSFCCNLNVHLEMLFSFILSICCNELQRFNIQSAWYYHLKIKKSEILLIFKVLSVLYIFSKYIPERVCKW